MLVLHTFTTQTNHHFHYNSHHTSVPNKSIKLEPYDVTTMYAYAQGGSHQVVGPPHYASPPSYHMSPHMTTHHQLAASMPLATSLGAASAVDQHHLQNEHMALHAPMHHMEPQLTELATQTKRRRYVVDSFWFYGEVFDGLCERSFCEPSYFMERPHSDII